MDLTYYSLILLTLIGFLLVRRGVHQTEVCKIMGIKIASEEVLELNKNGYQNSLTDPSGNKWFFLGWILFLAGLSFMWRNYGFWLALGSLSISFVITSIYGATILSKPDQPKYHADVLRSLYNRKDQFLKQNDVMRAGAITYLIELVEKEYRLLK